MCEQWLGICIATGMLATCSSDNGQQQDTIAPQPAVCNGSIAEISGADPRFEPLNPTANQGYQRDDRSYKIAQDPPHFSQAGLAAIYDTEPGSNLTAFGEAFDPMRLTVAHPMLPVPSYARITNLADSRTIVVRINDRGLYGNDRVISFSRTAADYLNTPDNAKMCIDPIIVAQDGSLSGPEVTYTTVARQIHALPARPNLSGGGSIGSTSAPSDVGQPRGDIRLVSNSTLKSDDTTSTPVSSSRFLGVPITLTAGALEGNESTPAPQPITTTSVMPTAPIATLATVAAPAPAPAAVANRHHVVQADAVSKQLHAQQHQKRLNQQFGIPGRVMQSGAAWRTQVGSFASKAEASTLQQRL